MLDSLMTDLARHCGGAKFRVSPAGHVRFVCDGMIDVTLVEEPAGGVIRAVALPLASPTMDDQEWEPADWDVSIWHDVDFDGFICRHAQAGVVAVTAATPAARLDSVSFPEWLSSLLDCAYEVLVSSAGGNS